MGTLLSVSSELGELWWLYDLGLLIAILILILILSFIKKQDYKKDGDKNLKHAKRLLSSVKICKPIRRKPKLMTAENLLRSAIYNLGKYADKYDAYTIKNKVVQLSGVQNAVAELSRSASQMSNAEIAASVDSLIAKIDE